MNRPRILAASGAAALALLAGPAVGRAQEGAGTTGAQVLQFALGGRAGALSGAYTAATGDADVLFYNPAGVADLRAAAALSYQRHVENITLGTAAGALRTGPVVLGLAAAFLDAGVVQVQEPDPEYGGQRGRQTGATVGASETALRLAAGLPLLSGRLRVGAAAGIVATDLAGSGRTAPAFDAGAQFDVGPLTLAAALRNAGGALRGGGLAEAPLPTEARAGLALQLATSAALGATLSADLVSRLREGSTGIAAGLEAGLLPRGPGRFGAVGRIGYTTDGGDGGLGSIELGAGISRGPVAVDYSYQELDFFGPVHRFGVRWARGAP